MFTIVPALVFVKMLLATLFTVAFTPEGISAIVGAIIMMLFAYLPGLRQAYGALASEKKSWIMLGSLLFAEVVICILALTNVIITEPAFSLEVALKVAWFLVVSNQASYQIFPPATDVKALVLARDAKIALTLVKHPIPVEPPPTSSTGRIG